LKTRQSSADLIALHRRYNDDVLNAGNLDLIDALFAADYVGHAPPGPDRLGPAALKGFVAETRAAFPDLLFTVEDRRVDGDGLMARWTARGTHRGAFMGVPATGRQVIISGIAIHRFAAGQIVESWDYMDDLGLLLQLGAIPTQRAQV
jgi:steroid delta-isomerase-like uncharacterized protein